MKGWGFPSPWVWWYCGGGALGWLALLYLWWRTGDVKGAANLVCRGAGALGWVLGYLIAGFWLFSFAAVVVLAVVVGLAWVIGRLRMR